MTTFLDLLARRMRLDPSSPFVTYYDDATGERTELSVVTYANWISKTANLFADELMLDPGMSIRVDLRPHWLGAVFAGGALACGLEVVGDGPADVAVVGPDGLENLVDAGTVLATALHPFATRFPDGVPAGVVDHGTVWAGQSDVFSPVEPTDLGEVAGNDDRVITDLDPTSPHGTALLVALLAGTGSLVLVGRPDEARWPAHSQSERATAVLRADQPIS